MMILICCTAMGFWYGQTFIKKAQMSTDFRNFHRAYLHNLKTKRLPITELLERGAYSEEFIKRFKACLYHRESVKDRLWTDYCSVLGNSDATSQQAVVSSYTDEIERVCLENQTKAKKNASLYRKLGFLLGVFIVILIL